MPAYWTLKRVYDRAVVRVNEPVRVVQMNGCMAHVRSAVFPGRVHTIFTKKAYGDIEQRPYATVWLDNGTTMDICAEHTEWTRAEDGVMENRR